MFFERLLIMGRRTICSTTSVLCKFKYSSEEIEKILSVVNNSNVEDLTARFVITEGRAKKLQLGRQQAGRDVDSIDEILDIGGFNVNVLNQFCKSILKEGNPTADKVKKARNRSFTLPPISNDLIDHINTFTSIHCGMAGLSWSTFELSPNENTKVTHWDCRSLPESKLNLYQLAGFITNVFKDIPQSNFYVFENPSAPNIGTSSKINLNVQISQMIGMASVMAAQNNNLPIITTEEEPVAGIPNVAYIRKFLFARLFKLHVGTEQTSSTNCVDNLIRTTNIARLMDGNIQTIVDVDASLKSMYSKSQSSDKDFLGCSFLLGLAFLRLSLLQCPNSIKSVQK